MEMKEHVMNSQALRSSGHSVEQPDSNRQRRPGRLQEATAQTFLKAQSREAAGTSVADRAQAVFKTVSEPENVCSKIFSDIERKYGQIWHICTPGENQQVIFISKDDYEFGMMAMAMAAFECPEVKILTFELMANHIHMIACGDCEACEGLFIAFRRKLSYYLSVRKSGVSLEKFKARYIPIADLESLRVHIVYVNRNNFLVDPSQTPWSYPYGANCFYFSEIHKKNSRCRYGNLFMRDKKALTHSHSCNYPDEALMIDNYISPVSFCDISLGESLFRDARHYFHKISRDIEGYREVSSMTGDMVFCTYEELMAAAYAICNKKYDGLKPNLLSPDAKLELARTLHYDYKATSKSISKILNLDIRILNEMFPSR